MPQFKIHKNTSVVDRLALPIWLKTAKKILAGQERVIPGNLTPLIKKFYQDKKRAVPLLVKKYKTPFYVFDRQALITSCRDFKNAFKKFIPDCSYYYAIKSNWHPLVLAEAVRQGFNLDVSSGRELRLALKAKAKKMVFSGPGKTQEDFQLALSHRNKVIVHLDSFGELRRLGELTVRQHKSIEAGVRIFTKQHGSWSKFGIDLGELKKFFQTAQKYPLLKLRGIQFHISWNKDVIAYQKVIKEVADYLRANFSQVALAQIRFIDFGGGYFPRQTIADYPWIKDQGDLIKKLSDISNTPAKFKKNYYITEAVTLNQYAQGIAQAINKYLRPLVKQAVYFAEPGRIISTNSMFAVLKVADVKANDKVILDGGVNMVGYEGLRYDYTPLVNFTHFSVVEKSCRILGSLCMVDDIWGYSCYASKIKEGDVLVIPAFGAYTYSYVQDFIKGIPPVYQL